MKVLKNALGIILMLPANLILLLGYALYLYGECTIELAVWLAERALQLLEED